MSSNVTIVGGNSQNPVMIAAWASIKTKADTDALVGMDITLIQGGDLATWLYGFIEP
jgi:hypothetical protein